jgi:phospholipid/cholesterol/gamma-HCH transport system substrate-binding protein
MRSHFLNYTLVGLFVTAMVVALVWGLASISGRTGPTDSYSILMDNVTDIDFGTIVRYEGYKVGQIDAVVLNGAGQMPVPPGGGLAQGWRIPRIRSRASPPPARRRTVEISAGKSPGSWRWAAIQADRRPIFSR